METPNTNAPAGSFPPAPPQGHVYGAVKPGVNFRLKPDTKNLITLLKDATAEAPVSIDRSTAAAKEAIKHELVLVDTAKAQGEMVPMILSDAGRAKLASYSSSAGAGTGTPRGPQPKPEDFEIEDVTIPEIKRGAAARQVYPFDSLEVGKGFFIPASETTPNPAKSKQSTVTAANKKAAAEFETRKAAGGVAEGEVARKFRIWPDEKNGVKGARIGREF